MNEKSSCSCTTIKNCQCIHQRGWRGHHGDVPTVPGAAKHPLCPSSQGTTRKHTQHTPLLLMLGSSPVGLPRRMIGQRMGGEVDGDWTGGLSRTLLSYASVLSRKRAGSKQGRTKMMMWEMGVIWGLQGEGRKWRTEERERRGEERKKRGGGDWNWAILHCSPIFHPEDY